jgi:hypothetical protein
MRFAIALPITLANRQAKKSPSTKKGLFYLGWYKATKKYQSVAVRTQLMSTQILYAKLG